MPSRRTSRCSAWSTMGHDREYACCRVGDLQAARADVRVFDCWRKEDIPAAEAELVVASQGQCAHELRIPVEQIRAAWSDLRPEHSPPSIARRTVYASV